MATYALTDKAVVLRPEDDVAVAKAELAAGTVLDDGGHPIAVRQDIRPGHKVARKSVVTGAPVRRYGQVIGFATRDIAVGDHVHTQNLGIGEDHLALQRVLAGYAKHPNVAAYILVGLGCETNQAAVMVERQRMSAPGHPERKPFLVNIQEAGGIRKTVERAAQEVAKLLPFANEARRSRQPVSELVLATNCGGSDANSGMTANPALGWAVDELVRYGGTGVLAETPEIYGAEHLLIRRAVNEGVAKKLIDRYKWWEGYCRG